MEEKANKKRLDKKIKISIAIIMVIISTVIVSLVVIKNNTYILYSEDYSNYSWGFVSYGYTIYNDGRIEEYNSKKTDEELSKAKISREELRKLKELINKTQDKYNGNINPMTTAIEQGSLVLNVGMDVGTLKQKIYKKKENKWITLYKSGNPMGYNEVDETAEILKLVESLYNKYCNNK